MLIFRLAYLGVVADMRCYFKVRSIMLANVMNLVTEAATVCVSIALVCNLIDMPCSTLTVILI